MISCMGIDDKTFMVVHESHPYYEYGNNYGKL